MVELGIVEGTLLEGDETFGAGDFALGVGWVNVEQRSGSAIVNGYVVRRTVGLSAAER